MDFDQFLRNEFGTSSPDIENPILFNCNKDICGSDEVQNDRVNSDIGLSVQGEDCCFEDLLEEAAQHFEGKRPDFCVKDKKEKTRHVMIVETQQEAQLVFRQWPKSHYGFWVYMDIIGEKHILTFRKGGYYVWKGINLGFDDKAVALPIQEKTRTSVTPAAEDAGIEKYTTPVRSLRKRTARQERPYAMYNLQRATEKQGIQATEAELEASLGFKNSRPKSECAEHEVRQILPFDSPAILPLPNPPSTTPHSSLKTDLSTIQPRSTNKSTDQFYRAVLRTRLQTCTGPSMPIYLSSIQSCAQLFDKLHHNWSFRLDGSTIAYGIVKFVWLDDDKSILLREHDEDGYRLMLDEFRQSPKWTSVGVMDADLDVHLA